MKRNKNEVNFQEKLCKLLKEHLKIYDPNGEVYFGNEFKNTKYKKALERPDLILISTKLPKKLSIIGIECKDGTKNKGVLDQITEGLANQVLSKEKYLNKNFEITKTKEKIKLEIMCFTNIPAIKEGYFYTKHYKKSSKFFLERIINKMGGCSLTFNQKEFSIYYKNKRYFLNGSYKIVRSWNE